MKTKQIERAIKKTIEKNQVISINNIVLNSLFISEGTINEYEVKKYLDRNYFLFKHGFFMFIESDKSVFLNYSRPLKIVLDYNYTYKVLKTKIKAIKGFEGFREHISKNSKIENTFFHENSWLIKKYELKYLR